MYRGSSFLLQRDYKIHKPVISTLYSPKFSCLWDVDLVGGDAPWAELVVCAAESVKERYREGLSAWRGRQGDKASIEPSDTLATKVLLGTMVCCPAYDSFFKVGAKRFGIKQTFGKDSLLGVIEFYRKYERQICELRDERAKTGHPTPIMRIIDLIFWIQGEKQDSENHREKKT